MTTHEVSKVVADCFYVSDMIHIITVNRVVFEDYVSVSGIWPCTAVRNLYWANENFKC